MQEYEVEVIQKNIMYVMAESESQAISQAIRDVQMIAPDEVNCRVLSPLNDNNTEVNNDKYI